MMSYLQCTKTILTVNFLHATDMVIRASDSENYLKNVTFPSSVDLLMRFIKLYYFNEMKIV